MESENHGGLAEEQYRLAANANPGNFDVRFRLAESLLNMSDFPAALPHLDWCLNTRPTDPAVRFARLLLASPGEKSGSRSDRGGIDSGESVERAGPHPALCARLGCEDPANAVDFARRAVRLEPANSVAASTLAEALRGIQLVEEAAAWEEKARTLTERKERVTVLTRDALYHEHDVEVRYQLGSCY